MRLVLLPFALSFVMAGCDGCEKSPTTAVVDASTAPTIAMTPDAGVTLAADAPDGGHPMSNCPTAVPGSDVAIRDVDGGVEVVITTKDDAALKEVRTRAAKISDAEKMADTLDASAATTRHDHSGAGGGQTGRCTVILRNTKLTTTEIPNGAKVTVLPRDKAELDWLRRETRSRDIEAKSGNAQGAGAQRMAHCPSAVEGAKTVVKDAKEGVVVTVTGPADKVGDIRARAKHTADVAKKGEGSKVQHSGEGTGGGGVGRCPIVVDGNTTVDVKEVPNGVEVSVLTKKDVPALQKEARERADNFSSK